MKRKAASAHASGTAAQVALHLIARIHRASQCGAQHVLVFCPSPVASELCAVADVEVEYLPPAKEKSETLHLCDGGVASNNPSLQATAFASAYLAEQDGAVAVLSLGCGTHLQKILHLLNPA